VAVALAAVVALFMAGVIAGAHGPLPVCLAVFSVVFLGIVTTQFRECVPQREYVFPAEPLLASLFERPPPSPLV
jgi:hypothetical protein